ncbi:MAG: ribonuclease III [Candidatus Zixiibacteriota bacterium]
MRLHLGSLLRKILKKDSGDLSQLQSRLGFFFRDQTLLQQALTHRSFCEDRDSSYERLEFLGDSVIGLIISQFLYENFPRKAEGDLTKIKASLVSEITLAQVAQSISLGEFIRMSKEEKKAGGQEKASITSDAYEALIGAVFLDGGLSQTTRIIDKHILSRIYQIIKNESFRNYKGELLECLQAQGRRLPRYQVLEEKGPDHEKKFVIAVFVKGDEWGRGSGTTKKEAEQNAAKMALEKFEEKEKPR